MRSIQGILSLLLALLGGNAAAEWTAVRLGNDIYAAYADKATIRAADGMVRMSGLYDFQTRDFTPGGLALFSTVVLREYDCAGRRVRLLSLIDFSDHMGAGTAVATSTRPGRWENIVAESLDEAFLQVACGAN